MMISHERDSHLASLDAVVTPVATSASRTPADFPFRGARQGDLCSILRADGRADGRTNTTCLE